MRRVLQATAALAVTALCAALLAVDLERRALGAVITAVDPLPLLAAAGVALALPFWRGARLAALLPPARRPGRGRLTGIAAEVLLWNFVLPFKLGELSFPWLLHRRLDLSLAEAAALVVLVRLSDLLVVAGLLALGAAALPQVAAHGLAMLAFASGLALLAAPLALIVVAGRFRARLGAKRGRLAALIEGASHARSARARLAVLATTLGLWASHAAIAALAIVATATPAGIGATVVAAAAGNLAFALPVSGVLGLGPQQVAFAGTLEFAGVEWTRAVAAALVLHAVVTATAVAAGLVAWWRSPRPARPLPRGRWRPIA